MSLNEFIFILAASINCCSTSSRSWRRPQLTAMHNSSHAENLYLRVRNLEPPKSDDYKDARLRQLICHEITSNEYFSERDEYAVDEDTIREAIKAENKNLYKLIYKWRTSTFNPFVKRSISRRGRIYQNPYAQRKFFLRRHVGEDRVESVTVTDYVFVCLTTYSHARDLRAYYVTKEYNVGDITTSSPNECLVGRFVFSFERRFEALVEEAAWARVSPEFNVELHYLKRRRRHQTVPIDEGNLDPVCRMTLRKDGPNDQWLRLCKSALGSLYFKTIVRRVRKETGEGSCHFMELSFRTDEARRQVADNQRRYYEWMVPCSAEKVRTGERVLFYISRAYVSNQVFVYSADESKEVYLENLSRNINVVESENVRFALQRGPSSNASASSPSSVEW